MSKPLVYIAGPYSSGDQVLNVRAAVDAANQLVDAGGAVHVPHLSMLWHAMTPKLVDDWYAIDLDVLEHCDLLVRLPGRSTGTDNEVIAARSLGIPVLDMADALDVLRGVSS